MVGAVGIEPATLDSSGSMNVELNMADMKAEMKPHLGAGRSFVPSTEQSILSF